MQTISPLETCAQQLPALEAALATLDSNHPLYAVIRDTAKALAELKAWDFSHAVPDATRVALTDPGYHWQPINAATPRGVKMQVINRYAGVAVQGSVGSKESYFTHWAPLPTFRDDEPVGSSLGLGHKAQS